MLVGLHGDMWRTADREVSPTLIDPISFTLVLIATIRPLATREIKLSKITLKASIYSGRRDTLGSTN
jgi:hypothetical protein